MLLSVCRYCCLSVCLCVVGSEALGDDALAVDADDEVLVDTVETPAAIECEVSIQGPA